MGLEPLRAEAKRTIGRGPQRATGAPSVASPSLVLSLPAFAVGRSPGSRRLFPTSPGCRGFGLVFLDRPISIQS